MTYTASYNTWVLLQEDPGHVIREGNEKRFRPVVKTVNLDNYIDTIPDLTEKQRDEWNEKIIKTYEI